jgi:Flp pilus assembly protein TadG
MRRTTSTRRGNIVVLSAFLIVAMLAMAAFAVDLGYIADAKNELQRAADAAALAAAARLPNTSAAVPVALSCAGNNQTSITPVLQIQDIVFGFWDRDTAMFHNPRPSGRPYNSVKVTLRRTAANGNPLNLFFGRVLGKHSADITATAVAFGDRGLCGPFIGIDELSAGGNLTTDSFDSYDGSYVSSMAGNRGSVCSDGPITVSGDAAIRGDVQAGEEDDIYIGGSSEEVTGQIGNRMTALNLPAVDPSGAAVINSNASLLPYPDPDGSGSIQPLHPVSRDFTLISGAVYSLPPGTYYFHDMTLAGGSTLNIVGQTTIYLTGDLDRQAGSIINNNTALAANLRIRMTGGTADIANNNLFHGVIYGPNTDITYRGTAEYFGALVGKTLTITGDATAHYDESLDVNLGAYALRVMLVD